MLEVYIDGSCYPNPGNGGFGTVIKGGGLDLIVSEKVEGRVTNNYCEYSALVFALKKLIELEKNLEPITIYSDSQLIILQMTGKQKIAKGGMYAPLYLEALCLLELFEDIHFKQISREGNCEADRLAREAVNK